MENSLNLATQNHNRTLCIIACHTTTPTKIKLIVNNLTFLSQIADHFVLIDSNECESNNLREAIYAKHPSLNVDYKYVENDPVFICHAKYMYYFQNFSYSQYEQIIVTNDSYIICRPLNNFGSLLNQNYDMVGLLASNQIRYHFPDFLRCYKTRSIPALVNYFANNRNLVHDNLSLVITYEIDSTYVFSNRKALYDPESDDNIHFHDGEITKYLLHKDYPVIKLKKMYEGYHPAIDKMLKDINF